jgi:hypothetical protein
LNVFLEKTGPEGSGTNTFKTETQSTRPERRNIGYNVLESIKKDDAGSTSPTHPGKMKHDLFKLEGLSFSNVIGRH